ncbi:MAG: hypothetical protein RL141_561 [Candidatus Parcubacteria bacterium]|jgi:archaellum component FlaC
MKQEPTTQDILDALQVFSSHVDEQFGKVNEEIASIKGDITGIKGEMTGMKGEASSMKGEMAGIKQELVAMRSVMVTKDYLDDKMADLRGDLVTLVRKEDRKLAAVVEELVKRSIFDEPTARRIFELEPFARM